MLARPFSRIAVNMLSATALACLAAAEDKVSDAGGFDVHEWGVLAGCGHDTNYFATSRPLKVYAVREPVLYIHSRDKLPFSLRVTFVTGRPTETYPTATVTGASLQWTNVQIQADPPPVRRGFSREAFAPLKEIMATLGDVDADTLVCGDQASRFLFYEGEIPFTNRVTWQVDLTNRTAMIRNAGDWPVYDLCLVQAGPHVGGLMFAVQPLVAYVKSLGANQTAETALQPVPRELSFEAQLTALGFTQKEAASFNTLWVRPFLQPGQLVYRLSGDQCARVTELTFEPRPANCLRALYVVVKDQGSGPVSQPAK